MLISDYHMLQDMDAKKKKRHTFYRVASSEGAYCTRCWLQPLRRCANAERPTLGEVVDVFSGYFCSRGPKSSHLSAGVVLEVRWMF